MKTFRVGLALLSLGLSLQAQDAQLPAMLPPSTATTAQPRSPQELEQLLAPIALYPDALIALILPASTVPTDVVLAARHVRENPGDRSQIEHRAWDESVKSLTNYPEVVQWMDENLHWTQQVGEAFATQSADVMQAIQRLRAKARAAGTLVDTPQQQVIAEPQVIRIVPAQPDLIYVPHYEPEIIFVERPTYDGRPFLTFGTGVAVGSWLAFDCDWRRHSIWVGNRHRRWSGHDWHRPVVPFAATHAPHHTRHPEVRQWRPAPSPARTSVTVTHRFRPDVARPAPFGLATSRTSTYREPGAASRHGDFHSTPTAPTSPRNFRPGFRADATGSQQSTPPPRVVAPPIVTTPPSQPVDPTPSTDGTNSTRRGRDWSRDNNSRDNNNSRTDNNNDRSRGDDNRGRSFRNNPQPAPTPPVVTTPSVAPTVPMNTSRPNHSMGNASPRAFSRSNPAPDTAPGLRMHGRSAPPPAAVPPPQPAPAPVATPPPAQSTPQQVAPARSGGTEHRGHRGAYRRDN